MQWDATNDQYCTLNDCDQDFEYTLPIFTSDYQPEEKDIYDHRCDMIILEAFSDVELSIPFESDIVQVTIDNAQSPPSVLISVANETLGFSSSIFFKGSTLSGNSNFIEF